MRQDAFLAELQAQAEKQAQLHHHRFLPSQLDVITSFIGRYPWQVMLFVSGLTAIILELV